MPRGYRCIVLAAVGWLILANAEQRGGANQQQQNEPRTAQVASIPKSPHSESASQAKEHCYPGSEEGVSCDGIAAQAAVDQARDADKQTATVWWQFGVGALTLAAAFGAAIFAWSAAHHTKRAADAADKALDLEYRPWLIVTPKAEGMATLSQEGFSISFVVTIKNVGNGVARNIFNGIGQENICGTQTDWVEALYDQWLVGAQAATASGRLLQPGDETGYRTDFFFPAEVIARGGPIEGEVRPFLPAFVFAVSYRSILSDEWHQTGKSLMLNANRLTEYGAYDCEIFAFEEEMTAGRAT